MKVRYTDADQLVQASVDNKHRNRSICCISDGLGNESVVRTVRGRSRALKSGPGPHSVKLLKRVLHRVDILFEVLKMSKSQEEEPWPLKINK